jgi:hypothetical protein
MPSNAMPSAPLSKRTIHDYCRAVCETALKRAVIALEQGERLRMIVFPRGSGNVNPSVSYSQFRTGDQHR